MRCEMYRGRDSVGEHDNDGRYGYVSIRRYTPHANLMAKMIGCAYLLWSRTQDVYNATLTLLTPAYTSTVAATAT
jgi:hypothetical protein